MIEVMMSTQPNDETCGPTSLHAIYAYYGDTISLEQVIQEVEHVPTGGTIAPLLGKHALARGYESYLYVYNLNIFDPSWFHPRQADPTYIMQKLQAQLQYRQSSRHLESTIAYSQYIEQGGQLRYHDLTVGLLKLHFKARAPILTGLSATYLYQSKREYADVRGVSMLDDVRGEPLGHFVVLCGYDEHNRRIVVADPYRKNPISHDNYYKVKVTRLINSIMLGVLTYDATLLVVRPKLL